MPKRACPEFISRFSMRQYHPPPPLPASPCKGEEKKLKSKEKKKEKKRGVHFSPLPTKFKTGLNHAADLPKASAAPIPHALRKLSSGLSSSTDSNFRQR